MLSAELVNQAWNQGLMPPPLTSVSEWADSNRVLGPSSPEPGVYRTDRTPYLRQIMETLSPSSPAREIDFMKGSQIGGTEIAYNWLGFIIGENPANTMCVLPSQDVAKEWSQQRLSQLIEDTTSLHGKIKEARARDSGNSTFSKRFGGCYLKLAWASSAKKLRSTPAKNIICDEVDSFDSDTEKEGDPIVILRRRFTNFFDGKFYRVSTPTDRGTSRIERGFKEGDQRYYFVPCPFCSHYQRLAFVRLRWDKGNFGSVRYECVSCEKAIPERFKGQMLAGGIWIATKALPEEILSVGIAAAELKSLDHIFSQMKSAAHASFHLSALYSPLGWYSWTTVAEDWEKAQGNTKALKVFTMTILGETWVDRGEAPEWESLFQRAGEYAQGIAPAGVLFLTAGVDVQGNRLEVEIVGWGRNHHSWSIDYRVISGDPNADATWSELESYLRAPIEHESGGSLPISVIGIDTGYNASIIYKFAKKFPRAIHSQAGTRVAQSLTLVPTKGGHSATRIIENVSSEDAARARQGLKIVMIGTHAAKQELYDWLKSKPVAGESGAVSYPSGWIRFPGYAPTYFQGLCSESRVTRESGRVEWVKDPNVRNEPLDCRVINRAAAALFGIDGFTEKHWSALELAVAPTLLRDSSGLPAEQVKRGRVFARFRGNN